MTTPSKPAHDDPARRPTPPEGQPGVRPVVPAIPSESGVGEEDPGDFENASIRKGDGKPPHTPRSIPGEQR